jgi:hypothetical protein
LGWVRRERVDDEGADPTDREDLDANLVGEGAKLMHPLRILKDLLGNLK